MSGSRYRPVKAYQNEEFLHSVDARPLRILAEYLEPSTRFEEFKIRDTIVIFGSARFLPRDEAERRLEEARKEDDPEEVARAELGVEMSRYYEASRELARRLTDWSKGLTDQGRRFVICSGGGPGIMEAANRGASEARGENVGLNISLPFEQSDNPYITRRLSLDFHYFFMRKFWFSYLAKAIVIMPGGFGTLDEFFEVLTLVQTGKIRKAMPIVLFGAKFWSEVLNLEALVRHGTISPGDLDLFFQTDSVDDAFHHLVHELETKAIEDPGVGL